MSDKLKSKLRVLELIREKKNVLFGSLSPIITNVDKDEAWREITGFAIDHGLIPSNKESKYIRDIYWQNARKRTMKKIDESKKTGAKGGPNVKLDDLDQIVLDIIGKF